ncbi:MULTISPECIES: penicillin-binding transpeptidase domain-containing protein [unclassified Isoptericola]|uniref:penicillin-binding transpeptidase domain-containing protein n=1 Tax=unclassified Isoptericola TaxID=2623355 RepID=UPI002714125F|nr:MULTISPECIES: penicillin-binding transpeptidase domain-containing protein [unclassified Isoptericola]MDO8145776.1 penicillin-binding transpeptidase domain-containing protein [Isoptericola sp. 178]MDO8147883.1 penicillin-binding transpeptidase domain-containing protein [Isoptericola sp. b515]
MRRRTSFALTVLLTSAVLAAAGCTGPERPAPDDTAEALADGLARQDLSALTLVSDTSAIPQQQLTEVVEPLVAAAGDGDAVPDVTVAEVVEATTEEDEPPRASVRLAWSWPLAAGHTWDYTTETEMVWAPPPEDSEEPGTWEVRWGPDVIVPGLAGGERLELEVLAPDRGDLLDVRGEPLVTARDVWRIGIDKTFLEPEEYEQQATELAELVGLDPAAYAARVEGAGDKAYVEAITIRQDRKTSGVSFTARDARSIAGVNVLADTMELAPTSSFARPILGRAGEATAEIIEESDGAVQRGDVVGLSGLQRDYDAVLTGTDGLAVHVVAGEDGEVLRDAYRVEGVDGADVATTFDPDLQVLAEKVLADVEPASAIVAVRPSTGEVLAAASGPGGAGWSTATLGQYAPGSTFKVATALSLMRSGVFPEDTVRCPRRITVDGRTYENVPGYPQEATGEVTLRTAFAHSCNTAMIGAGAEVRQADLAAAAVDLGLGEPAVGAPAFLGAVPTEASATGHAEALIGQGKVLASPLGMATVAASVAAGERVEPFLVRPAEGEDDDSASPSPSAEDATAEPAEEPAGTADGLGASEAADLQDLMGAVVSDGSASELADVPGVTGAKTGTAQYGDGSQQHAWMLAIADDLAVAVFVEDGEFGSTTAGPLMGRFLTGR